MEPGTEFKVPYPFILTTGYECDEEGPSYFPSWKPGTEEIPAGPEGSEMVYHGVGSMVLTVVATFKPKGWPTRVFYTRKWIDPQGRTFGKNGLRITTLGYFNQMKRGFRYRQTAKRGGVEETAEALAKSLNITPAELLARMGVA